MLTIFFVVLLQLANSVELVFPPQCVDPTASTIPCCDALNATYHSQCLRSYDCIADPNNPILVSRLVMQECGFQLRVPQSITQMTSLTYLDLSFNAFIGMPAANWSNLVNLTYMDLQSNKMTGFAGTGFFGLNKTEYIDLSNNTFQGFAPDLVELPALRHLDLSVNLMAIAIAADFGHLLSLFSLDLSENRLQGTLPPVFNMPDLQMINLAGNFFEGDMPTFGLDKNMTYIDLSDNNFVGTIPMANYARFRGSLAKLFLGGNSQLRCPVADYSSLATLTDFASSYGGNGQQNCAPGPAPGPSPSDSGNGNKLDGVEIFLIILLIVFVCGLGFYCYRQHNDPSKYVTLAEDGTL